ncbi:MAG TPA: alcohol dehydrogenase catalytic domain-containing protein [Thermoanaerobaculia bacterium]|nr:alcohol dehydrogenase catalytic domain-containing protein [Thermoanaerobaculia bacterium]
MRAAVAHSVDRVEVVTREVPPIGPGEILVAMKAVGICGSDTTGWYVETKAPAILGHEPAGVVVEAGEGTRFEPDDRVVVHHHAACGRCRFCLAGEDVQCAEWRKNRLDPGGLAEYVRIDAAAVRADVLFLPDEVSFEDGALVEPVACAVKAVRRAAVHRGDTAAVIGLGANGVALGLVARAAGAWKLVGCDPDPARRAHALRLGFDQVAEPGEDFSPKVKRVSADGADAVFVLPTAEEAVRAALAAAAPAGRIVFYSPVQPGKRWTFEPHLPYLRDLSMLFSYSSSARDLAEALQLIRRGVVRASDLVTHRVPLADAPEAFRLARRGGDVLKVMVTI